MCGLPARGEALLALMPFAFIYFRIGPFVVSFR